MFHIKLLLMFGLLCGSSQVFTQTQSEIPESNTTPSSLETGKTLYQQGRFDEALALFQQSVKQDGGSAPAHYWLGMTQYALGDFREALSSFRKAMQRDKSWAPGYIGLGKTFLKLKNRKLDARNVLRTAARLEPDNADAQYHLGIFLHECQKGTCHRRQRSGWESVFPKSR